MAKKQEYSELEAEVIRFEDEDVITTSTTETTPKPTNGAIF